MHHESLEQAEPGDNVGFNIKGLSIKDISRGNVASNAKDKPAKKSRRFYAQVIVLNHNNVTDNYTPVLDCHTAHIACKFNTIVCEIDPRNGAVKRKADKDTKLVLKKNQACYAVMVPQKDMCVESYSDFAPLGRFAIRDMRRTVAVGVVKKVQFFGDGPEPTGKVKNKLKQLGEAFTREDDSLHTLKTHQNGLPRFLLRRLRRRLQDRQGPGEVRLQGRQGRHLPRVRHLPRWRRVPRRPLRR